MNRLTTDDTYCEHTNCDAELDGCGGTCWQKERWERLQAYERTGLEPETIRGVVQSILNLEAVKGFDYLKSLVNADAEGRLVLLPCKEGTKCYRVSFSLSGNHKIEERYFSLTYNRPEDFGKSMFLTREEAEAALTKEAENET